MAGLVENWTPQAKCAGIEPDMLFVTRAEQNIAKKICSGCPVRLECLADALDNRIEHGVWGGMTERERRQLQRRHPGFQSWRQLFDMTMKQSEVTGDTNTPNRQQQDIAPALGDKALGPVVPPAPMPGIGPAV